MISTTHLSDLFVEVADTLVDDFDLVLFLQSLTRHVAIISEADAVGLMLADHLNELRFMAASNESGETLDLLQLQNQEGPCLDCFVTGEPVINVDLAHGQERWPSFAPVALAAGFTAVHSFPMRLRDSVIGTINAFTVEGGPLGGDEARVVQGLADIATIAILQERSISRAEALTEQLQSALNSRIVIEQAKGAVAQTFGVTVEQAFEMLRRHARSHHLRLTDLAHTVVNSPGAASVLRH
jgi:GAF domain-containing protein